MLESSNFIIGNKYCQLIFLRRAHFVQENVCQIQVRITAACELFFEVKMVAHAKTASSVTTQLHECFSSGQPFYISVQQSA